MPQLWENRSGWSITTSEMLLWTWSIVGRPPGTRRCSASVLRSHGAMVEDVVSHLPRFFGWPAAVVGAVFDFAAGFATSCRGYSLWGSSWWEPYSKAIVFELVLLVPNVQARYTFADSVFWLVTLWFSLIVARFSWCGTLLSNCIAYLSICINLTIAFE